VKLPVRIPIIGPGVCNRKAYWPLRRDSAPEPTPQAAPLEVVTVIDALADFDVSVTEIAVIVSKGYAGTVAGAV
jgi:hypothetical protein